MVFWLLIGVCLYYVQVFSPAGERLKALGFGDYLGARTGTVELKGLAGRLERASDNYKENFLPFAVLALATIALGIGDNGQAVLGAQIFVLSRIAYVILYAFAVPVVRSLAAIVGWAGLVVMAVPLIAMI